jgi:oligopeptidase B
MPRPLTRWPRLFLVCSVLAFLGTCLTSNPIAARPATEPASAISPQTVPSTGTAPLSPPVAPKKPKTLTLHGDSREDPYFWLRERDNPEVIAYLEAENAFAEAFMKDTEDLQKSLFEEMRARIKETDLSVPARDGEFWYYTRTVEGLQYPIHCRQRGSLDASETVLLDLNELASGSPYFALGSFKVSPDHALLAYSEDRRGNEKFTLRVKDLTTGDLRPDMVPEVTYGVTWAEDGRHLFYATMDESERPNRIWRHELGTPAASDTLIFEETDIKFSVSLGKTRSRTFILFASSSTTTSEIRFLPADQPLHEPVVFAARRPGIEYGLDHHDNRFFVHTNDGARNFRVLTTPVDAIAPENWVEFIPARDDVKVDDLDLFTDHLVVHERREGLQQMRIYRFADRTFTDVRFPESVYGYWAGENPEFNTDRYRFVYTSLTTPRSVFDLVLTDGRWELQKQYEVLGGFKSENYQAERLFATAPDGTRVPISLVYRRGFTQDGSAPMYLTGYGSYGSSFDPYFSSNRLSLLDRGFVYAIAHIRGGEEMGRPWYEDGKLLKKRNSFTDFIACAEHLVAEKYTSPGKLAVQGGSAGGLLMGAVLNLRPDLFGAMVADVPFVDVLSTMLDPTLPLTTSEYEEWGNPEEKESYAYMRTYSPYDNVTAQKYPPLLVTAGLNDPRVQYWEPAKWVARLRQLKTDQNPLILKTNMAAGHAGASGRYDYLKEIALEFAFIFKIFGVPTTLPTPKE